ncbi:N-acetylmuramoyl-L-alanine amidase [Immundisolibacter sp.]|uniref:N-acetylmuramoyl-L-alanine amidase n=1 Tax=Immundisolibacter sp. TaxID=1934948 RepID=UPI003F84F4CB
MKRLFLSLLALLPLVGHAGELRGVRLAPLDDGTRVILDLSAPTAAKVFSLSNPDRLVVDLPATRLSGDLTAPDGTVLRGIRSGPQAGGALRVVLDLATPVRWEQASLPAAGPYGPRLLLDLRGTHRGAAPPIAARPSTSAPPAAPPGKAVLRSQAADAVTIVIDAGHGGHDPGAIGPNKLREKDITLAVARELAAQINAQRGMRAVLTRSDDRFLELRERTAVAHKHKADLFISIHADAVAKGTARGSSVYALSENGASSEFARLLAARENAAGMPPGLATAGQDRMLRSVLLDLSQNATIESSLRLAERLLDRLADVNKLHRSDVQQAGFMVLKSPQVPSVLVETAFISTPEEARKLADPAFRRRLASALVAGVRDYLQTEPRLRQALANAEAGHTPALRRRDGGG